MRRPGGGAGRDAIRRLRTAAGLRQADAAHRMGLGQGALSKREGKSILDLTLRSVVQHVRATDPGARVTVDATGVVVEGSSFAIAVPLGAADGGPAEG